MLDIFYGWVIKLSRSELLASIEDLRLRLHNLIEDGFTYSEVLRVSQELDRLIVEYYQVFALAGYRDDACVIGLPYLSTSGN